MNQVQTTVVAVAAGTVILAAGGGLLAHQNASVGHKASLLQAQLTADRAAAAKAQSDAATAKAKTAVEQLKVEAAAAKAKQQAALAKAQRDATDAKAMASENAKAPPIVLVVPGPAYNAPFYNAGSASATLNTYFNAITTGDYSTAFSQLDAHQQARQGSLASFRRGLLSSFDTNVAVNSVSNLGDGRIVVNVSFHSHQDPDQGVNPGETDTNWNIDYTLVPGGGAGGYLIHSTANASHYAA